MSNNRRAAITIARTIAIVIVVLLVVRPWGRMPAADTYALTTIVSPSGGGSVSPAPGEYECGANVTLMASPASGYMFLKWTGSVGTIANVMSAVTTVTMNTDCSIVANFEEWAVNLPDASIGTTIRGPISEDGSIRPADVQGHTFRLTG